jgi:hypothetical protein
MRKPLIVIGAVLFMVVLVGMRATPSLSEHSPLKYRYITDSASSQRLAIATGFNLLDEGADPSLVDALPDGVGALVWLGDYDNTRCEFEHDDAWIRERLAPFRGDPKVAGYYIADEPHNASCPLAPRQLAARTAVIHKLTPGQFTYQVIEGGDDHLDEYAAFHDAADVTGIDPYPCTYREGCRYWVIDQAVRRARQAGIKRLWAVVQAFGDEYYRYPSSDELQAILNEWREMPIEGQQTFAWSYRGNTLDSKPDLRRILLDYNRHG